MPDLDDRLLAAAFADFRNEVAPLVKPAGAATAHETVRHRRRVRTTTAVALAALAVAVPVAAYAAVSGDPDGPPVPPAESAAVTSAPPVAPEPSSEAPSPSGPPDGRITRDELGRSTLSIPAWAPDAHVKGCVSGPVKFSGAAHFIRDSVHVHIDKVVYADVDLDGAKETVASLSCGDQVSTFQVVAFDRDEAGGIRTIGQVARQTGAVLAICDIRAAAGDTGAVDVRVGDYPTPLRCLEPAPYVQFQWRTYSWNGTRFGQTAGPGAFPNNPRVSDLVVTTTDLVFERPEVGPYSGSMTVTVRNAGESAVPYQLVINMPDGLAVDPGGCSLETYPQVVTLTCDGPALAPGGTRTRTVTFNPPAPVTSQSVPAVSAHPAEGYADWNRDDNTAEFRIVF